MSGPGSYFHILAKPTGATCNLDCKYCFYLSKEKLYPNSRFRMSDEVLEAYLRQLLSAQTGPVATVAWQGGEPTLMGLDFYRRAVELDERLRRPGQKVERTFQTNGVLLDDAWCELFREKEFLVGLSIDGPREPP
ncbi:MAG: radical SAM protein [Myxococcales bacterium]